MFRRLAEYLRWFARWRSRPVPAWVAATLLYNQGRYRESIPLYLAGLEQFPKHPAAGAIRLDLAYALVRIRQVVPAITQLKVSAQSDPECLETLLKLAHLQSWIGRDADVVSGITRALPQLPSSQKLYAMLALSSLRLSGGMALVEKILSQDPNFYIVRDDRGAHLLEVARAKHQILTGQHHLGRKNLLDLCSTESPSLEALIALSEFLLAQGKIIFARQQLRRALSLVPHQPLVLALLAETYLVEGAGYQPNFAVQLALSGAQSSAWSSPDALYSLAKAYLFADDSHAALMVLNRARNEMASRLNLYRVGEPIELLREQLQSATPKFNPSTDL